MSAQPRILVIGHTGQVGRELLALLADRENVLSAGRGNGADLLIDLADNGSIDACLAQAKPDWIINAAAYNAVDQAESESDLAMQINGHAPAAMAEWAGKNGATLIHYSTDYVFDGAKEAPYTEDDEPNPLSVYAESKLAGEQAVLNGPAPGAVLRTSWVFSPHGNNFVKGMHRLLQEKDALSIVSDHQGVPTSATTLAELTLRLLDQPETHQRQSLLHGCNSGATSRYGWVDALREWLAANGNGKLADLTPVPSSAFPQDAERPSYSVMDNQRLAARLGVEIPAWTPALGDCLRKLQA